MFVIIWFAARVLPLLGVLLGALLGTAAPASAAVARQVAGLVDETRLATLSDTRPRGAHAARDTGAVADDAALDSVAIVLNRPAAAQAALDVLTTAQLEPASASYHRWLTPAELGAAYGPNASDIAAVAGWLTGHGLTVDAVAPTGMSITASGTAAQFAAAFHVQLRHVVGADGRAHIAPDADLAVPASLAGIVRGATLSDYFPHPVVRPAGAVRRQGGGWKLTQPAPDFTVNDGGYTYYAVAPADFATIYHLTPLRTGSGVGAAVTGAGVGIAVIEDTDIQAADWLSFRAAFGLSGYTGGSLNTVHPGGCSDPGRTADEIEAALDAEWASAVAPAAAIVVASCGSTATSFGVMTALQGLVNQGTTASVISISYGGCEAENGMAFQQMWTNLVQEGAAEGLSIFVAAGDSGSAACDSGSAAARDGLAVNGLASNGYDTAIGGTDFLDAAQGQLATYWSSGNGATEGSALSYVPETPWNDSCASQVIYQFVGLADPVAACNSNTLAEYRNVVGGGGGNSTLYSKPSWQQASGVPNNGVRNLPDASLFAADGVWGHFYIYCMSDQAEGGTPCNFGNAADVVASGAGGTSFAAPAFAGIQALIVQHKSYIRQGNAAPRLYALAQSWASYFGQSQCRASLGNGVGASCIFHTVDIGTTAVPCIEGSANCYVNNESTRRYGVLSTSTAADVPAWPAATVWSYANGLGSVNITNLVANY